MSWVCYVGVTGAGPGGRSGTPDEDFQSSVYGHILNHWGLTPKPGKSNSEAYNGSGFAPTGVQGQSPWSGEKPPPLKLKAF